MQAAEQSHHRIQLLIYLVLCKLFEALFELVVTVESHVMRGFVVLIHEGLEGDIPRLLEPHIRAESLHNHIIDLLFEFQHLDREFEWVLPVLLVVDDFATLLCDIGLHLVYNEFESSVHAAVDFVHYIELVEFLLIKHVLTPRLHESQRLGLLLNALLQSDVKDLFLGLWLQEVLGVVLLFFEVV